MYVIFALVIAHSSLAEIEATPTHRVGEGRVLVASTPVLSGSERLDRLDTETYQSGPDCDDCKKCEYTIEAWTATWCSPCKRWKRDELPALLKLGYKVKLRDIDTEEAPDSVTKVPTICVYYKGRIVQTRTYWRAKDIDKFIKARKK